MKRQRALAGVVLGVSLVIAGCSSSGDGAVPAQPGAAPVAAKPAVTPVMLEQGRRLYKANCASCHGDAGKGDGVAAAIFKPPPTDHTDRAYMDAMTDEDLAKVIQMGGAMRGKPLMPSNPQIRGADLEALVAFTRSLSTAGE